MMPALLLLGGENLSRGTCGPNSCKFVMGRQRCTVGIAVVSVSFKWAK